MLGAGGAACREGGQRGPDGTAGPSCSGGVRNFIWGTRDRDTETLKKEVRGRMRWWEKSGGSETVCPGPLIGEDRPERRQDEALGAEVGGPKRSSLVKHGRPTLACSGVQDESGYRAPVDRVDPSMGNLGAASQPGAALDGGSALWAGEL